MVSALAWKAAWMAGRTLQTTVLIRSTTVENSRVRVYCRSATSSNRASMALGSRACSRAARAMTVTGLCAANRSKMSSRTMVPPPWNVTISRCGDTLADVLLQLQSPGIVGHLREDEQIAEAEGVGVLPTLLGIPVGARDGHVVQRPVLGLVLPDCGTDRAVSDGVNPPSLGGRWEPRARKRRPKPGARLNQP